MNLLKFLVATIVMMLTLQSSQNFSVLLDNMQAVLDLWRTRDLTIEGKIQVSKMQYWAMMSNAPNSMIKTLKVIHNKFF